MSDLSTAPAVWFHKPTVLNQSVFSLPVLGYLNPVQAFMIFGMGVPGTFLAMQLAPMHYSVIPLAAMTALAMLRPPVISYEARLVAILRFLLSGKGRRGRASRSSSLAAPARNREYSRRRDEPLTVRATGRPMELSLRLRSRDGAPYGDRKVRLLIDGRETKTTVSTPAGEVLMILEPGECRGERIVSVNPVLADGSVDESILKKRILFEND